MLICTGCNIEYEEDKKYCKFCGDPLVPKTEPISTQKKVNKNEEERSDGKLICPHCKLIYEFGSSCIQCGLPLARQSPPQTKEEPKIAHRPQVEEKLHEEESSQKQRAETSPKNLVCPTCKIAYENGKYCIKCGSALITQIPTELKQEPEIALSPEEEGKFLQLQTLQEQLIQTPSKNLICPDCRIIYERGNTCIRCGSALVTQIPSQEGEKPQLSETPEIDLLIPQPEGQDLPSPRAQANGLKVAPEGPPFPDLKEHESIAIEAVKSEKPEVTHRIAKTKKETAQTQLSEQPLPKKLDDDAGERLSFPGRLKKDYRRILLEVGSVSIMVVAGGYFLWSIYSHFTKQPEPTTPTFKEESSQRLPRSSSSTNPTASMKESKDAQNKMTEKDSYISEEETPAGTAPPFPLTASKTSSAEIQEIENIKTLLENIRQANLQKNIDLFISCYAIDFKDREGKKKATLTYWKNFDYLNLSYELKNPSISVDSAKTRVEWLIKISPKIGGQSQETKTLLDVILKKEEGGWKIKEVKQVG